MGSIQAKIWVCVGVAFLGFFIAAASTLISGASLSNNLSELRDVEYPQALSGIEAVTLFNQQTKLFEDSFLLGEEDSVTEGAALSAAIQDLLGGMIDRAGEHDHNNAAEVKLLEELRDDYTSYASQAVKTYGELVMGVDLEMIQGDVASVGQAQARLLESLETLSSELILAVETEIENSKSISRGNINTMLVLLPLVLVISVITINVVSRRLLVKPLRKIQDTVHELAQGRLNISEGLKIHDRGEIGELATSITEMDGKLTTMVTRLLESALELGQISEQVQESSARVGDAAGSQSEEVERTSAAMMRINSSVEEVGGGVTSLLSSSEETTSSILEMSATNDEVANNMDVLARAVDEVTTSVTQMAATIRQVAENAGSLKEASETTASAAIELDASITQIEGNARETRNIGVEVSRDAVEGKEAVDASMEGMARIQQASAVTADAVKSLAQKATSIGSILQVINDMNDQTNLLSLNAAIIAAQAGEYGKGFAVVADEIKTLADRTGQSTNEISRVIDEVTMEIERAVLAMQEVESAISEGSALSVKSGETLTKILEGVTSSVSQMEMIADATVEQGQATRRIREAMENVSERVTEIAAATEQQQEGSSVILESSRKMQNLTSQVKTATWEQNRAGKEIASAMEKMNGLVMDIRTSTDEQLRESREVAGAVGGIRDSSGVSLDSAEGLIGAADSLDNQMNVLQGEMASFTVSGMRRSGSNGKGQSRGGNGSERSLRPVSDPMIRDTQDPAEEHAH
jgi:methyl-accepting chemotaxis protein